MSHQGIDTVIPRNDPRNPQTRKRHDSRKFCSRGESRKVHPDAKLPSYKTAGAIGADLFLFDPEGKITEVGHQVVRLPTGIALTPPAGFYAHVAPRSGLGNEGLHLVAEIVDPDYTGEVMVAAIVAPGHPPIKIKSGDRIAQLVFLRSNQVAFAEVADLDETDRGAGGFGSTGRSA